MIKKSLSFLLVFSLIICLITLLQDRDSKSIRLAITEEFEGQHLDVIGQFPDWLDGVYIRNSAIPFYQSEIQISHPFDGIAMLYSIKFEHGHPLFSNRYIKSENYESIQNGITDFNGFASKTSLWQKTRDFFKSDNQKLNNTSVNVFKYGNDFVALTEVPLPVIFNLLTLETLGSFDFHDNLPQSKCWECAHPHYNLTNGEIINYLIEFSMQSHYVLYRLNTVSKQREVVAKIPVAKPSYMHSFSVTDNYIILTEFPLVVSPFDLLISAKPFIENFTWEPERGTRFHVVEKKSGKVVFQGRSDPIFCFHHANAYEESPQTLCIDLIAYSNLEPLSKIFPYQPSETKVKPDWEQRAIRYRIDLVERLVSDETLLQRNVEFPRLSDALDGKPYRYLYMTLEDPDEGIIKLDVDTKEVVIWKENGLKAIEPIFVSSPYAEQEDDGIILTIVQDETSSQSFVIALDAHNLNELGRASLPFYIPGNLHGQFFSETSFSSK